MAAEIEDLCRKRIIRSTAEALGAYLQERRLTEKKIWQLQMAELESISEAMISAYILAESREQKVIDRQPKEQPASNFSD